MVQPGLPSVSLVCWTGLILSWWPWGFLESQKYSLTLRLPRSEIFSRLLLKDSFPHGRIGEGVGHRCSGGLSLVSFIGVLPGGGAIISSFVAYAVEKRVSKHPEEFGKGAIEGVAAPEAANNAASTSSFIPLLTLGIPGNATIAMIFVALMIHGIRPGPLLLQEHPNLFWGVIASMYIGNIMLLALNLPLIGMWVRLLKVPYHFLAVVVVIVCVIGAYSVKSAVFDVGTMVAFGVMGYLMRKGGFPPAPLILAMILGPILERSLQQSLISSGGDPSIFIEKPISAALLCVAAFLMLTPILKRLWRRKGLIQSS